jgi:alpha-tubulin suppressor-like RCC1 family protein
MAVAAGGEHTVVVGEDGIVFSFGGNHTGGLGISNNDTKLVPTRVAGLPPSSGPVRQVTAGFHHTGMVTEAGDLLMCGDGWNGQLGLGDKEDRTTPTLVERAEFKGEAVLMVACGFAHTAVATEGGGVYTFGDGKQGQLGHGDEEDQLAPRRVPEAEFRPNGSAEGPDERIVMVAAGCRHTVALSEAGHVFTWGLGEDGQLGHGDGDDQWAPQQVEAGRFGGEKVVFVAAGGNHTAAVTAGGQLYTWGWNCHGQLGHGDTGSRLVPTVVGAFGASEGRQVVMAACGALHTLVVTQDGGLWASGCGYDGILGLNDGQARRVFEQVGGFGGARVVSAAAEYEHSVAVTEDGALWTWGEGKRGRLGHGDEEDRWVPTRVAADSLRDTRIGRCHPLPTAHALAFSMGTHGRLGAASPLATLAGEPGLLTMIASAANRWIGGAAGECEGLFRLLGGVSADRRRRYVQTTQAGS